MNEASVVFYGKWGHKITGPFTLGPTQIHQVLASFFSHNIIRCNSLRGRRAADRVANCFVYNKHTCIKL